MSASQTQQVANSIGSKRAELNLDSSGGKLPHKKILMRMLEPFTQVERLFFLK
jgi:hypothetical protein